jgi:hypothetical protein
MWTVGTSDFVGAGNVGEGPKLNSSGVVDGAAQAASGTTTLAIRKGRTRMEPPASVQPGAAQLMTAQQMSCPMLTICGW